MTNEGIRGSSASAFLSCPAYGAWKGLPEAHSGPVHCGTLCGSMAHGLVTGHKYEMPKAVTWDGDTQSLNDLEWQSASIAKAAERWLDDAKIIDREIEMQVDGITGHIDLVIERDGCVSIVDLKTGHRKPGSATWTQLAVYSWMHDRLARETESV